MNLNIVTANTEMTPDLICLDLYCMCVVYVPCPGATKSTVKVVYTFKRKKGSNCFWLTIII